LIVVCAIIVILAAPILTGVKGFRKKQMLSVARAELAQIETALTDYRARYGSYPQDNPNSVVVNPLFFELAGTVFDPTVERYVTLDRSAQIRRVDLGLATVYGGSLPTISAFINTGETAKGDDETAGPKNFLTTFRATQLAPINPSVAPLADIKIIVSSIRWPVGVTPYPVPGNPDVNPWRYNSSNPTNNPNSYDLWIDLPFGGKFYRVSNWSNKEQSVTYP